MRSNKTYAEKKLQQISTDEEAKAQADELIKTLRKELQKFGEVSAVVMFGSFARGDYSTRHSDIDVMVFIDKENEDVQLEEKIRKAIIKHNLGKIIGAHVLFQHKNVGEEDRSLMLTIAKEGKVIFARKTIVISQNILGLKSFILLRFDTTGKQPVVKNRLHRFLHGYTLKGKHYKGIIDGENVFSAGQGAIIVPEGLLDKVMLFVGRLGISAVQKGRFYR